MAFIAPFKGLHYNPAKVANLTAVVTPPYDVIRPDERQIFAARDPHNMVQRFKVANWWLNAAGTSKS